VAPRSCRLFDSWIDFALRSGNHDATFGREALTREEERAADGQAAF